MNEPLNTMPLGIDGFTYADLYEPSRLRDLHEIFCARVAADDPSLWAHWDAYRTAPDSVTSPIERSDLIVRMAPHLSRFVTALFRVGGAAGEIAENTHRLEPLFRFKIDFVRKRALPLVKGGAHVTLSPQDIAIVEELSQHWAHLDREQAIAMAGCELLDRETAARDKGSAEEKADIAAKVDALKRWCAASLHDSRFSSWVVFRFPETMDYFNLVHVQRPRPELPEAMLGPDSRLRRRDGFKLTDAALDAARGRQRDPLLRAVPRARQGLVLEGAARQGRQGFARTRSGLRCPAARSTKRSPRCTWCGSRATPSARWPSW